MLRMLSDSIPTRSKRDKDIPIFSEDDLVAPYAINSSGNINLDTGNNHIVLKDDGNEFGRLTHNGGQLDIKSGANQLFLSANNTNATFANNLTVTNNLIVNKKVLT